MAGGTVGGLLQGKSFEEAIQDSFKGIGTSMALGGAIGVASTITVSYANGINPWTGKAIVTAKDLGLESDVSRIKEGIKYPSRNDGTTFQNREGLLPDHSLFEKIFNTKYYKEYVVPTSGLQGPGPQRIVSGKFGDWYYTPDHYKSFIKFKP